MLIRLCLTGKHHASVFATFIYLTGRSAVSTNLKHFIKNSLCARKVFFANCYGLIVVSHDMDKVNWMRWVQPNRTVQLLCVLSKKHSYPALSRTECQQGDVYAEYIYVINISGTVRELAINNIRFACLSSFLKYINIP